MELLLTRDPSVDGATIGQLFIDGTFFGWTLEDVVRAPGVKIYGETAIPPGRYRVIINKSQRFGRMLPLVLNVNGFDGIRLHPGNDANDTQGCILVGLARTGDNRILSSRAAMDKLMPILATALANHQDVWLTVQNQPVEQKVIAEDATPT